MSPCAARIGRDAVPRRARRAALRPARLARTAAAHPRPRRRVQLRTQGLPEAGQTPTYPPRRPRRQRQRQRDQLVVGQLARRQRRAGHRRAARRRRRRSRRRSRTAPTRPRAGSTRDLKAATGRGCHLYFAAATVALGNSSGRLGRGLDVRGHGGYVVAPPSLHALGQRYRWIHRCRPAPLPAWIQELLTTSASPPSATPSSPPRGGSRRRRYLAAALRGELSDVASAQRGTRNNALNRAAFRLGRLARPDDATLADVESYLLDAALAAGLTERDALATIDSGLRAGQRHPR